MMKFAPFPAAACFIAGLTIMTCRAEQVAPLAFPKDGGVLNVKERFGAKGDGRTDDTAALQAAITAAISRGDRNSCPPIIYLPPGEYLVSDTLATRLKDTSWSHGWRSGMVMHGAGRTLTTIRLKDGAAGFDSKSQPKPVILTGSENPRGEAGSGAEAFRHSLYHLTINTGKGNPGAEAVDYIVNNHGAIEEVTLRSEDGDGVTGLRMTRTGCGPGLLKNLEILGFDAAIRMAGYEFGMTVEGLRIEGQKEVGITLVNNQLFIRRLRSTNAVTAIESPSGSAQVVLIESELTGGSSSNPAIVNGGVLLMRDVKLEGYGVGVKNTVGTEEGVGSGTGFVAEFISHDPITAGGAKPATLRLPIEETPVYENPDLTQWANVVDFGAKPGDEKFDSSDAIQKAIDSGKPVVYLPQGFYEISKPIRIRGSVRKITGLEAWVRPPKDYKGDLFIFENEEPVAFEHIKTRGAPLIVKGPGTVTIRHCVLGGVKDRPTLQTTSSATGKVFLEDVCVGRISIEGPAKVWARQLNVEASKGVQIDNQKGDLWILGLKTEHPIPVIRTASGARTELLGGLLFPSQAKAGENAPAFMVERGGKASLTFAIGRKPYTILLKGASGGTVRAEDAPKRAGGSNVALMTAQ